MYFYCTFCIIAAAYVSLLQLMYNCFCLYIVAVVHVITAVYVLFMQLMYQRQLLLCMYFLCSLCIIAAAHV